MIIIYSDLVFSHYGQAYVHLEDAHEWDKDVRKNQENGLLGAAEPTVLFLTFGLHTGKIHLIIRVAQIDPGLDETWEEIVEASFAMPVSQTLGFSDWNGRVWEPIPLAPGPYRVRYCARDFGNGEECSMGESTTHPTETYELTFWPAPLASDRIVKVTSTNAQYWHEVAQGKAR